MSWQFNPPPGWPRQPEGWVPPPGWAPDPSWPPAPEGWQFWVPAATATPSTPAAEATSGLDTAPATATSGETTAPVTGERTAPAEQTSPSGAPGSPAPTSPAPTSSAPTSSSDTGSTAPAGPGAPTGAEPGSPATPDAGTQPYLADTAPPYAASQTYAAGAASPPYPAGPQPYAATTTAIGPVAPTSTPGVPPSGPVGAPAKPARPWFGRWWAWLVLVVLLLIGACTGFGVTRLIAAVNAVQEDFNAAVTELESFASPEPERTLPPLPPPVRGDRDPRLCRQVEAIMVELENTRPAEVNTPQDEQAFIQAHMQAALGLRMLSPVDDAQRSAVEALAGELEVAALYPQFWPGDPAAVDRAVNLVNGAYEFFRWTEEC